MRGVMSMDLGYRAFVRTLRCGIAWDRLRSKLRGAKMSHLRRPITKADASDFLGRFRKIIPAPLILLIEREARSGFVEDGLVYLHNGNRVAVRGPMAYYDG